MTNDSAKEDHDSIFKVAYQKLNNEQKRAVDTIEGPVMVVAGPGTGKTQILTLRIANILLQTDTKPENILALTFTESGARAMRARLRSFIGARAYQVAIHTFHSFAGELIRRYPDAYTRVIGGRPISDLEAVELLETILADSEIKVLRPVGNPSFYVRPILAALSSLKRENIRPDDLAKIITDAEAVLQQIEPIHQQGAHKGKVRGEYKEAEKQLERKRELLLVYRLYEAALVDRKWYDFEDMIVETVAALESDEEMLRDLQENYQYLLADEHQDVNGSQNRILELLSNYHQQPNIFVVGDEKQAIYRFQGASLENFLYFEDRFGVATTIALTENYRSGQKILNAAHSLVAVDAGPLQSLRVPLKAAAVEAAQVNSCAYTHQTIEDAAVVEAVKSLVEGGVEPEEVAVILRTNREVEHYAEALRRVGLNVEASAEGDILTHPITNSVLSLMTAVAEPSNEQAVFTLLHGAYWQLIPADLVRVLGARNFTVTLAGLIANKDKLIDLGVEQPEKLQRVSTVLAKAREQEVIEAPHQVLAAVLSESGFLDHVMTHDPVEGGRVLRRLYDEIELLVRQEQVSSLAEVVKRFKLRIEHGLPLVAAYLNTGDHSVQVMTAHKAKGLEFAHVFVPHLSDNLWGGRRHPDYFKLPLLKHLQADDFDPLDDEKRLLYVAMTRAKTGLYLSCAETNTEGSALSPSRLLSEIDSDELEITEETAIATEFDALATLRSQPKRPILEPTFLTSILKERGLSATALNNYLNSPWQYIYRNILRVPEVQSLSMQYGTAIHNVLEKVTRKHTATGQWPTTTELKTWLDEALSGLPLSVTDYTKLHEKGLASLSVYLEHLQSSLGQTSKEEFAIRVVLPTGNTQLPELPLTGKLDRLDLDTDGRLLRVVDYKTGRPKTRGEIEGTTKNSNGEYKRQLTFYALLLDLLDDERYRCRTGVLSFVEPDKNGEIKEETFVITDEEIAELKQEILQVVNEITTGEVLNAVCDSTKCDYCHLVDSLLPDT